MAFTYDAVGNRLTGPVYSKANTFLQSDSYDYDNRIVSATKQVTGNPNADTVTFKYDPFGRRIEKNVATFESGIPTTYKYTYVYDNEDIILEVLERTQNGNTTTTTTAYTHGPGIDEPLSLTRDGQTWYYHADGLGSITSISDSAQAVVNRYAYDSFGALKSSETIRNAYAYTGREYDSETGLYYYRARYYDPEAGRFVSKDPIGFAGGDANQYVYSANDPVNWVDPWGNFQLPANPSNLPSGWIPENPSDPNPRTYINPTEPGRTLRFDPAQSGSSNFYKSKDHWHDNIPGRKGKENRKHRFPGEEVPDTPKIVPIPPRLPLVPIIINPCVLNPSLPFCCKTGGV
jgi:RHS repeat-associated protein